MSITKTEVLQRCETYPAQNSDLASTTNEANPTLMIVMEITFEDTANDEPPAVSSSVFMLSRYDAYGEPTVISGQIALVQSICGAIWA